MQRQIERYRPAPVHDPEGDGDLAGSRAQRVRTQGREAAQKAKEITEKAMGRTGRLLDAMRRQRGGQ